MGGTVTNDNDFSLRLSAFSKCSRMKMYYMSIQKELFQQKIS